MGVGSGGGSGTTHTTTRNTKNQSEVILFYPVESRETAGAHRMHIETGGPSRDQNNTSANSEESGRGGGRVGGRDRGLCDILSIKWGLKSFRSTASDPPEQQMVGAVVPSDCLAAIGQPEVLVAVAA